MARDRNILCENYIRARVCKLGRECNVFKEMQNCTLYKKDEKRKPFRVNNKRKKLDEIKKKDMRW